MKYNFNSVSTQENTQDYEFTGFSINEKTDYDTNKTEDFVIEENSNVDETFEKDSNLETIEDLENIAQEYITDDIETETTDDSNIEVYDYDEFEGENNEDLNIENHNNNEIETETTEDPNFENIDNGSNDAEDLASSKDNVINQLANEFKLLLTDLSQGKLPVENSLNMLSTYIDDLKFDLDNPEMPIENTSEKIETTLEENSLNTIPANAEPIETDEAPLNSISKNTEINSVKETISEFIKNNENKIDVTTNSTGTTENIDNTTDINNISEKNDTEIVETFEIDETQEHKGIFENIQLFKDISLFKHTNSISPTFENIELVETPKIIEDTIYNDKSHELINNENEIENLDNTENTTNYDEVIENTSEISTDNFEYEESVNNQINLDDIDVSEIFDNLGDITPFIENNQTYEDTNTEEASENICIVDKDIDYEVNDDKIFENAINDDGELLTKEIDKKIEIISSAEFDNETLIISERRKTIYLPYKIPELLHYIESYPNVYSSLQDVVKQEFILPFSYFIKHPYKSRFSESYNIIRNREGKGFIESVSYSVGVAKRHDLNPAIVAACKTQTELDSYLHFLDTNNLKMFNFFNIIYEVNPLNIK